MFDKNDQVEVMFNTRMYPATVIRDNEKTVTVKFHTQNGLITRRIDKDRVSHPTDNTVGPEFTEEEQRMCDYDENFTDTRNTFQRFCDWVKLKLIELFG